jgi:hypothetical protein
LREIGSPNFWPKETLEPVLLQYKKDHPQPQPQPPPICRGSADSANVAEELANVRFWHFSDMDPAPTNVRYRG